MTAQSPAAVHPPSPLRGQEPPAGIPGKSAPAGGSHAWRDIADLLAQRLARTGTPCGRHAPSAPAGDCPECGDEAALRVYRAAAALTDGVRQR